MTKQEFSKIGWDDWAEYVRVRAAERGIETIDELMQAVAPFVNSYMTNEKVKIAYLKEMGVLWLAKKLELLPPKTT